jgi:dihydroorotate dehydrogenase (NAD+) catalytic subunit
MTSTLIDVYNIEKSYEWNYEHGPLFALDIPKLHRTKPSFEFLGQKLHSPLGVPAGPLLNSQWVKLYAALGFDIPVYKTVRSVARPSHPAPNCAYVNGNRQLGVEDVGREILTRDTAPQSLHELTITNSFGVPSLEPKQWMADIEKANSYLGTGQVLIVSINGTPGLKNRSLEEDYAYCAALAKEAGAQIIEANYSCPNVCTGEGSIYSDAEFSARISGFIRKEIGNTPFLIKMGMVDTETKLENIVEKNRPFVDGFSGINTIAMNVRKPDGTQALPGKNRLKSGLCGNAIHDAGLSFTAQLARIKKKRRDDFVICGVGGMMTPQDLHKRLNAGADVVMTATAAMWDPYLASRFHSF